MCTGLVSVSAATWLDFGAKDAVRSNPPGWLEEKVPTHWTELGDAVDSVVQPTNCPPPALMLRLPLIGTGLSVSGSDKTARHCVSTPTRSWPSVHVKLRLSLCRGKPGT